MTDQSSARTCAQCGTQLAPGLLSCPACQRLVHADTLKRLAQEAEAATQAADASGALRAWREALELLPSNARQYQVVLARVTELSQQVEAATSKGPVQASTSHADAAGRKSWPKWVVALGPIG